ncbi:MAG: hypothetical protein IPP63_15275 [Chloracidobacterium sp.]|nr:hypothetical protein [Chloracidobacterium sp.]
MISAILKRTRELSKRPRALNWTALEQRPKDAGTMPIWRCPLDLDHLTLRGRW